jgi:hypothetical protein
MTGLLLANPQYPLTPINIVESQSRNVGSAQPISCSQQQDGEVAQTERCAAIHTPQ